MEQLFFNSTNIAAAQKPLATGELDLGARLRELAEQFPDAVQGVEDLPEGKLILEWAEFATPKALLEASKHLGEALVNGRLGQYKFQFLGGFRYDGEVVKGNDWQSEQPEQYEGFQMRIKGELAHTSRLAGNGACNCTWLLHALQRPEETFQNPDSIETLRWKKTYDGYQLTLTALSPDRSRSEAQTISFSSSFEWLKWEQHYALHASLYV